MNQTFSIRSKRPFRTWRRQFEVRAVPIALALLLAACSDGASGEADSAADMNQAPVFVPEPPPPASPEQEREAAMRDQLRVELDGALLELGTKSFEALHQQVRAAFEAPDLDAREELLRQFDAEHGALVSRATALMKSTPHTLAFELTQSKDLNVDDAEGEVSKTQNALHVMETPFEWEPVPPYFASSTWGGGSFNQLTGRFNISSQSTLAFDSWDGFWVRADHFPWSRGRTTVTARINVGLYSVAVIAAFGGAYADIHTRIDIANDRGATIQSCTTELLALVRATIIGSDEFRSSVVVERSCTYENEASRLHSVLLTMQAHTTAGGFGQANAFANGVVESIRARTAVHH